MKKIKPFSVHLALITLLLAILSGLTFYYLPAQYQTRAWPFLLTFLFITNIILFTLFLKVYQKKTSSYANYFMMATVIKLLVYLTIIIVYLIYHPEEAKAFLLSFLVYYLVFTFVEVRSVLKIHKEYVEETKRDNSKKSSHLLN